VTLESPFFSDKAKAEVAQRRVEMQVRITGKNIQLTEAMKNYVDKKIKRLEKYLDEPIGIQVILNVEKFRQIAEVNISSKSGSFYGSEESHDIYASIDMVMNKLEEQVRRRKEKIQQRPREPRPEEAVLSPSTEPGDDSQVVEVKRFAIKPMSLDEAVLQMDISEDHFMVFLNATTNRVNVLYKRKDGRYGLIDPQY
jgi:putative sigma-54 modulation protein